ncbi:OmpH family outer membrane protein [Ectothiorhodospiraceae bacterium WFHF3C12]|nr:OmpH family outer membrane protein [Ectothiorhodospiraceae bacterium WFHF3C12]
MIQKLLRVSLACLVLGAASAGAAQAQDLKVGFVNPSRVSSESPQAEAARRKLEQEFAPRDQELVEMQKELQKMEERLNRDAAIMSESERRKLEREVVERKREIRRAQEAFREDFNIRRNEELGNLQRRIVDTITQVAKERGFDLVVSDGVIFASDRIDITNLIIERLKKQAESGGGE